MLELSLDLLCIIFCRVYTDGDLKYKILIKFGLFLVSNKLCFLTKKEIKIYLKRYSQICVWFQIAALKQRGLIYIYSGRRRQIFTSFAF